MISISILLMIGCMCSTVSSSDEHDNHRQERFLPILSQIEPDPTLRISPQTRARRNGTVENGQEATQPKKMSGNSKTKTFRTTDGRQVKVFDDVVDFKLMAALLEYSNSMAEWEFHGSQSADSGPSPWSACLGPEPFETSALMTVWSSLLSSMEESNGGGDIRPPFAPMSVCLHVFRRGDNVSPKRDSDGKEQEFSLLLYYNPYWRKNDYGELFFYENDNSSFAVVSPKFKRMVIWDSSISYISKPPSMDFKQGMMYFKVRFTRNTTRQAEAKQQWQQCMEEKARARETLFSDMKESKVKSVDDVEKYLTKNYTTSEGKRLYVFDGLYDHDDLMKLRNFVPRHGKFYFDDSLDLDSDNVQWISGFSIDQYVQGAMWPVTTNVAAFVSGSDEWYPYDISCNLLRTYDHTRIHEDCEKLEREWTFLIYLTHDWSEEKYGETTFLHFNDHSSEHLISVLPRFGRVVIFEGIIPHSARPPSPTFNDARLTFVVKLSVDEWAGRVKCLKTEFGHEENFHQSCLELFKNYHNDKYEEEYQEMLLENAQELREINSALNKRFEKGDFSRLTREDDDDDDDVDDEADSDDYDIDDDRDHHHHLLFDEEEEAEYDEQAHFEGESYPEVEVRRQYVYGLLADKKRDVVTLRGHYSQFMQDLEDTKKLYKEQIEKLL